MLTWPKSSNAAIAPIAATPTVRTAIRVNLGSLRTRFLQEIGSARNRTSGDCRRADYPYQQLPPPSPVSRYPAAVDSSFVSPSSSARADARADSYVDLLNDMAAHWTRLASTRERVENELINEFSEELLELVTWIASRSQTTDATELVSGGRVIDDVDTPWCSTLGLVLSRHGEMPAISMPLLEHAVSNTRDMGKRRRYGLELVARLLQEGESSSATALAESLELNSLRRHGWVQCDLVHPGFRGSSATRGDWSTAWQSFFAQWRLSAPNVKWGGPAPLLSLALAVQPHPGKQDLVSVVVEPCDESDDQLHWTIDSLLNQSWPALQVIVPAVEGSRAIAKATEISENEPRVVVVSLPSHTGWKEREHSILAATSGVYLTWNPVGYWSHPERIARQVDALLEHNRSSVATMSLTASDDLTFVNATEEVLSSDSRVMLMRTAHVRQFGGRLDVGDVAEREIAERVRATTGTRTTTLEAPLVIRRSTSKPRSRHFRPDGPAVAREDIIQIFKAWHSKSQPEGTGTSPGNELIGAGLPPLSPNKQDIRCDILMAGDWHSYGGPQKSMVEEIEAFIQAGFSVGIMHLQPGRFIGTGKELLAPVAVDLILSGRVKLIQPQDQIQATVTFLRYPPTLQFRSKPLNISQDHLIIVANQAPSERDGTDIRYRVEDVRAHAESLFGQTALWAPQGPQVREALTGRVPPSELLDFDMPGILDVEQWAQSRDLRRSDRPVIGRHSRDNVMKWPEDRRQLLTIYPDTPEVDVRIMGGAKAVSKILGGDIPSRWLVLPRDEVPVRTFLNSLDFFVYFQHSEAYDAFGRAMLEALSTGVVAILPQRMQPVFGEAALYAEPDEVIAIVRDLFEHPYKYREQSRRALDYVRTNFSYESHLERVKRILAMPT